MYGPGKAGTCSPLAELFRCHSISALLAPGYLTTKAPSATFLVVMMTLMDKDVYA